MDNSVHSVITHKGLDVTEHMIKGTPLKRTPGKISVDFNHRNFTVEDNCGGISINEAKDQVFLLGHLNRERAPGLGVYGIGMKRAVFKIGRTITITSNTTDEEWEIEIDLDEWEKTEDWNFHFKHARKRRHVEGKTRVEITDLNPVAASQFDLKTFRSTVTERAAVTYSMFLRAGLRLAVNDIVVESHLPEFLLSPQIKPTRQFFKQDGVDVLIMAGIAPFEDRRPHGWYIFCNGRLVLDADKSMKTGWGTPRFPAFHSKYNHFVGLVFMRSENASKLPWSTTKDNVNLESIIYQRTLDEMSLHSRKIISFLNELYEETVDETGPQREMIAKADRIDPQKLASRRNQVFDAVAKPDKTEQVVHILYKRKRKLVEDIREYLEKPKMSGAAVGEYTFDWFHKRHCK